MTMRRRWVACTALNTRTLPSSPFRGGELVRGPICAVLVEKHERAVVEHEEAIGLFQEEQLLLRQAVHLVVGAEEFLKAWLEQWINPPQKDVRPALSRRAFAKATPCGIRSAGRFLLRSQKSEGRKT